MEWRIPGNEKGLIQGKTLSPADDLAETAEVRGS
jgi:hypothetical protein